MFFHSMSDCLSHTSPDNLSLQLPTSSPECEPITISHQGTPPQVPTPNSAVAPPEFTFIVLEAVSIFSLFLPAP